MFDRCFKWSTPGVNLRTFAVCVIFIKFDLDDGVINKLLKFADDTKIVSIVGTVEDVKVLQDDLHKLFQWSKDWQMLFSTDKSKIIHFGFNNNESSYVLGTSTLCTVDEDSNRIIGNNR